MCFFFSHGARGPKNVLVFSHRATEPGKILCFFFSHGNTEPGGQKMDFLSHRATEPGVNNVFIL